MKKVLTVLLGMALLMGAVVSRAEVDPRAMRAIDDIRKGKNTQWQIVDLRVKKTGTFGSNVTFAVGFTVTGTLTAVGSAAFGTNVTVGGNLSVTGPATFVSTLSAEDVASTDDMTVGDDLSVTGDVSIVSTLDVIGAMSTSNTITQTHSSTNGQISIVGFEASTARLLLDADQGDDAGDSFFIDSEVDGQLSFKQDTTEEFMIDSDGDIFATGDISALGGDIFLLSATNGRFAYQDGTQLVFIAGIVTNVIDSDIGN